MKQKIIIAVDGLSASGKGSVAKLLATEFNLAYLNTGLLYRAVGYYMLKNNISINEISKLVKVAQSLDLEQIHSLNLQSEQIAKAASLVARISEIRQALYLKQVEFANREFQGINGAILDGRDIGTVICPNAHLKFYFTATLQTRAQRRYEQLKLSNADINLIEVQNDLQRRDENDKRLHDLVMRTPGYIIIDNSDLTLKETFKVCQQHVDALNYKFS